jgi:hypothetical protein
MDETAPALQRPVPKQVIVLVESLEHAARLVTLLPGWTLVAASWPNLTGMSDRLRRNVESAMGTWCVGDKVIITTSAAHQYRLTHSHGPTAIIWAGSGVGLPPITDSWLVHEAGRDHQIVLIDIQDHHYATLARWSRCRAKAYRNAEWLPPQTDPVAARVEQFLARRPRSRTHV